MHALALILLATVHPAIGGAALGQELVPLAELVAEPELRRFYEEHGGRLVWTEHGEPNRAALALRRALEDAGSHGLRPMEYGIDAIGRAWPSGGKVDDPTSFDLMLSGAALRYVRDASQGRVLPERVDPGFSIERYPLSPVRLLQQALADAQPADALASLGPLHPGYAGLRSALARYRAIVAMGGWPAIAPGAVLSLGSRDARLPALRRRLSLEGDLSPTDAAQLVDLFDDALLLAVRRFQRRHGLDPDGVIGADTLAALNIPAERRLEQIERSMERWRWLPRYLGERHLLVNIPAFSVEFYADERKVLESRAIVGRPGRQSPRISAEATGISVNPSWTVPPTILWEDVLPELRRDPGWLSRHEMRIYRGWSPDAPEIDPYAVDWRSVSRTHLPYRIVQAPGPRNPLGRLKIEMPNPAGVYLHDTPDHRLFEGADRAKSSGCVRIERMTDLALTLLGPDWTDARLETLIASRASTIVPLAASVPVYFVYIPAVAQPDGGVAFHPDIYGLEPVLAAALEGVSAVVATESPEPCEPTVREQSG